MEGSISFRIQYLDLREEEARSLVHQVLETSKESLFEDDSGKRITREHLLNSLNAFENEYESSDLSLEELEELTGGLGLPEALVSSTILMTMVAGTSGLFTNGMNAVGNSSIQDALNAGIRADIESIRHDLSSHNLNDATGTYRPTAEDGEIGQDFIDSLNLEDIDVNSGTQTRENFGGQSVIRTIKADGNSITVTYSHSGGVAHSTSMVAPAAGWLS